MSHPTPETMPYPFRGPATLPKVERIRRNMNKLMNAELLDVVAAEDYSATLRAWNASLVEAMAEEGSQ